jgi:hypothetical protein
MFEMDERSSDFNENDDRARTRDNPRPFFNAAAQPRRCVKNTRNSLVSAPLYSSFQKRN